MSGDCRRQKAVAQGLRVWVGTAGSRQQFGREQTGNVLVSWKGERITSSQSLCEWMRPQRERLKQEEG